jgi:hypothetical protein
MPPKTNLRSQLDSLEQEYQSEVNNIRRETSDEKIAIIKRLEAEKQVLLSELYVQEDLNLLKSEEDFEKKRQTVLSGVSSTQTCSSCNTNHKYLSAVCIECKSVSVCDTCLRQEIAIECKCSNCSAVTNIICRACQKKKLREIGWFEFDSCRNGCGFLCPEHSTVLLCHYCGYHSFCDGPKRHSCEISQCAKCRIGLCSTCWKDDGCLCSSTFNQFDDSSGRTVATMSRRHSEAARAPSQVGTRSDSKHRCTL